MNNTTLFFFSTKLIYINVSQFRFFTCDIKDQEIVYKFDIWSIMGLFVTISFFNPFEGTLRLFININSHHKISKLY